MHTVELFCEQPWGARYVVCDEWHYTACLGKAADLEEAKAETREFLAIAELNRWRWQEDRKLVGDLIGRSWLFFHNVRDRNPDTDGWWIIVALLEEIRRGSLLAIKGPRNSLFPAPYSGTPLRNLVARTANRPNVELMLSVQFDLAARQARLVAASTAKAGDRYASTRLGDAQPFRYTRNTVSGDSFDIAKTPNNGKPGTWYTNPGSGQMRLYGSDGKGYIDLDFDHSHDGMRPHAHNWVDGNRDWAVVPFSPL